METNVQPKKGKTKMVTERVREEKDWKEERERVG